MLRNSVGRPIGAENLINDFSLSKRFSIAYYVNLFYRILCFYIFFVFLKVVFGLQFANCKQELARFMK